MSLFCAIILTKYDLKQEDKSFLCSPLRQERCVTMLKTVVRETNHYMKTLLSGHLAWPQY